ncbi:MAG: hypothetical protein KTR26_20100 [Flammeovirgaceae bacterium]|nr:hypothetical protein [Flammeovirgaceae bacterium]
MEKLNKNIKGLTIISAIYLLLVAFVFGIMLMASSHRVNFQDKAQLKFIIEIVVFVISPIILFMNIEKLNRFNIQVFIILILVNFSVFDIIRELLEEIEISISFMIQLVILYCLALFGVNILLLVSQISSLFKK